MDMSTYLPKYYYSDWRIYPKILMPTFLLALLSDIGYSSAVLSNIL